MNDSDRTKPKPADDKLIRLTARLTFREGRRWLRVTVEDHGNGIDEDMREHVFDPFFTTKRPDRGTGLGLSTSHRIMTDHGGRLTVETELGKYTRFHVDLPTVTVPEDLTFELRAADNGVEPQ